jgi:glycosyltransferase involved in cell wall biosynthesis
MLTPRRESLFANGCELRKAPKRIQIYQGIHRSSGTRMPKVTVLMAVYNGERYLRDAMESILCQTFEDFQFLIINDGSTDNTRDLILSYDDPRMVLVDSEHNVGQTRSLNRGLKLAAGELIARQDADDISEPERLARQVAFLERHPEVALLGTSYKEIDVQGTVVGKGKLPCDPTDIRWSLLFFCPFIHSSVMFVKSVIAEQIGFYNETFAYAQDHELWYRIARRFPVANLPEPLVRFRVSPWSMTATYGHGLHEGDRMSIAHIERLLGWDKIENMESNEVKFRAMSSLLQGGLTDLDPQAARKASNGILRLHSAFCQGYGILRRDCDTHRAKLTSHMSQRIIGRAHSSFDRGDCRAARQFLFEACRLYWPVLFTKTFVWAFLKWLRVAYLIRSIRKMLNRPMPSNPYQ